MGQALRRGARRVRLVKSEETPVTSRWVQWQNDATRLRSLATTSALSHCLTINDPRQGRTLPPRFLRGLTVGRLEVESEPSWLATSSAMSSNPASGGSGGCSRRDRAPRYERRFCSRSLHSSRREPSRPALALPPQSAAQRRCDGGIVASVTLPVATPLLGLLKLSVPINGVFVPFNRCASTPVQRLSVVFAHLTQPCQPSPKLRSGRPAHRPFRDPMRRW
jgi:hypothetical protein